MGFESLTEAEKAELKRERDAAKLLHELLTDGNADNRKSAMRLARQKRPDLRFPELEADEAEQRARTASSEEVKSLRQELEQERAQRLKAEEMSRIRERGFDPEAVYKAMAEKGIVSLDTALAVFEAEQQLAESTAGSVRKFRNPADDVPTELIPKNGPVDVEGLRSHLIGKYMDESSGRSRGNPLGFLRN